MSGPFPVRRTLTLMGILISVLIAVFLWTHWPEVTHAIQEVRSDEGLAWLIGSIASLVLMLLFYCSLRLYFYFTGSRMAARAQRRVGTLKQDGQAVSLCHKCGGTGTHGASLALSIGRTFLRRSVCATCQGTGLIRDCPACSYNLTGNVSGICPECGTKIAAAQDKP